MVMQPACVSMCPGGSLTGCPQDCHGIICLWVCQVLNFISELTVASVGLQTQSSGDVEQRCSLARQEVQSERREQTLKLMQVKVITFEIVRLQITFSACTKLYKCSLPPTGHIKRVSEQCTNSIALVSILMCVYQKHTINRTFPMSQDSSYVLELLPYLRTHPKSKDSSHELELFPCVVI